MNKKNIQIIYPASKPDDNQHKVDSLSIEGSEITLNPPSSSWGLAGYAGSPQHRAEILNAALMGQDQLILCARGGYGCSSLLDFIPWDKLKYQPPKYLIGFSDISALQSAIWTKLSWPSLHAPMPCTSYWEKPQELLELLTTPFEQWQGQIEIKPLNKVETPTYPSWLFGGCFTVLSSLIGTPYIPSLGGACVFLEDTGENPGRLYRAWQQWIHSDTLQGCKGIILGTFHSEEFKQELAASSPYPMWSSQDFGHQERNLPLLLGSRVNIQENQLLWQI